MRFIKYWIVTVSLAVFAGGAFAGDGSVPFELRDSSSGGAHVQSRPLPDVRAPLVGDPYRPRHSGPRPYWENDPLFTAAPR